MIEILQYFGLPVGISSVSGRIDEIIVIVHYLMLVLFVGWGIFFIVSLVKFRESKNIEKADIIVHSSYFPDRSGWRLVILMSLKITHTVVIILSIFLTSFFSYHMMASGSQNGFLFSFIGALSAIALTYYLFSILKKFKTI